MKDYSIEEMMLAGEAENRGYTKKAKRAFVRYNMALMKYAGKKIEELTKEDIDKFVEEQEEKYTKRTMDTLRSNIMLAMRAFRGREFAMSISRYKMRRK